MEIKVRVKWPKTKRNTYRTQRPKRSTSIALTKDASSGASPGDSQQATPEKRS
jgi:hypothetical protein